MVKEKTIALPMLPSDQFYCPMPRVVTEFLGSGFGKWELDLTTLAEYHLNTVHSSFCYGIRQIGNDAATTATIAKGAKKATDVAKQTAILKRITAIEDGSHVFGHGGGARLSTYLVVLREKISAALVTDCGEKKAAADKLARGDTETAYMLVCESIANKINKSRDSDSQTNADAVFGILWPRMIADAEVEAKRRDSTVDAVVSLAGIGDMLTTAAAKEPKADSSGT